MTVFRSTSAGLPRWRGGRVVFLLVLVVVLAVAAAQLLAWLVLMPFSDQLRGGWHALVSGVIQWVLLAPVAYAFFRWQQDGGTADGDTSLPSQQPDLLPAQTSVHQQVRWSLLLAFVLVGLLLAVQTWQTYRLERLRESDVEVINLSGLQRMFSQRMARMALLTSHDEPAAVQAQQEIVETLQRSISANTRLLQVLQIQEALQPDRSPQVQAALVDWAASRDRLWQAAERVVQRVDSRDLGARQDAVMALQPIADQALLAANSLLQALEAGAKMRSRSMSEILLWGAALSFALLVFLAIGLVEPVVRTVFRQYLRLTAQTRELERMAMVASHATTMVLITDMLGDVVWVNNAFCDTTGYTLSECMGKLPVRLLHLDLGNTEALARLHWAFQHGKGMRADMLGQLKHGRKCWLNIDMQPLHDKQGVLTGFIALGTDISELVDERAKLAALLAAMPTGVVVHNVAGEIVDCNPAAEASLQTRREQLLGHRVNEQPWTVIREDLSPWPVEDHPGMRVLRTGQPVGSEVLGLRAEDGQTRWLLVNAEPLNNVAGQLTGAVVCFVDVTEQRAQQQLLKLTVEGSGVGVWQWDMRTGDMLCSPQMFTMLGYANRDIGVSIDDWRALVHPDDLVVMRAVINRHLGAGQSGYKVQIRARRQDGDWATVMSSGMVVERDGTGRAQRLAGILVDVTEHVRLQEMLRLSARTDHLTQLPNRAVVLDLVRQGIVRLQATPGYHFAVLFMDFDRFKQVNDTLGHGVGDELLRQIAQRLQNALRPGDAYGKADGMGQTAARLGGDEFVVVLDGIRSANDAEVVAQRLLDALSLPYQIGPHAVSSTVSIGVVTSEGEVHTAESVLRDADTAMYEAKRAGRGRYVVFEPAMHERVAHSVGLENDLRHAIARNEIFVVYQPVVSLQTGRLQSVEALARWQHPQRGLVPAVQFIPVAEESGLITSIGEYVLEVACRQFQVWQQSLGDLAPQALAVNLSRAQLRKSNLASTVQAILFSTGMAAAQLVLEITESFAAQGEDVQLCLRELKHLGIQLALDDFGTGYSSLACLHQLPVDTVKIDRSFVMHAQTSDYHRVLIEATVKVAQTLGMGTVAEGIETPGQAALMLQLQCLRGQGFLFSQPLATEALGQWAAAGAAAHIMGGVLDAPAASPEPPSTTPPPAG